MWDPDKRRRDLYGKAGAFRPKPYGMEYRVLSNAWLRDIKTMSVVYDQTMKCCERFFMSRKKPLSDRFGETARILIDDSVVDWADHYQKIAHEVLHA